MQAFYNVIAVICLISLSIIAVTMLGILICLFVDAIIEGVKKGKKKKSKPSPRNALIFTKDGYAIYCKKLDLDFNAYEELERYKENNIKTLDN